MNGIISEKSIIEELCCEACLYATGEICKCRCGGLYHGEGVNLNREEADEIIHSPQFKKVLESKRCYCGSLLEGEPVRGYEHEGGWVVGDRKLWLYVKCPNPRCGRDWALWKLGFLKDVEVVE